MSTSFQIAQQVCLTLKLEQEKLGSGQETGIKCVQMYSLAYKSKDLVEVNNLIFLEKVMFFASRERG